MDYNFREIEKKWQKEWSTIGPTKSQRTLTVRNTTCSTCSLTLPARDCM